MLIHARITNPRVAALRMLIAIAVATLIAGGVALASHVNSQPAYVMITVRSGETIWSIAAAYSESDTDPREMVDAIVNDNALATSTIVPGERLRIRRYL